MNCPRSDCKNKAIQHSTLGVLPCLNCRKKDSQINHPTPPEFYSRSKQDRITQQRDHFAGDIAQPFDAEGKPNRTFVDRYPDQRDNYFSQEELRKL